MVDSKQESTQSNGDSSRKTQQIRDLLNKVGDRFKDQVSVQLHAFLSDLKRENKARNRILDERIARLEAGVPETTPVERPPEALTLNDRAVQHYYNNELEQAVQLLENAADSWPDSIEILSNLAMVYTALNRMEKAIATYKKAVALDPDRTDLLNNKGVLSMLAGKPEEAMDLFETSSNAHPQQIPLLLNLAQAHLTLGQVSKAITTWKLVTAIDPNQNEANQNLRQYYQ